MVRIPLLSLKLQVLSLFRGKSPWACTCTWHDNTIQLCLKFSRKREENTSTYSNWGRISQDEPQHKASEKSEFQTLSTNLDCSFYTKRPAKFTFWQWKIECFSWYELMLSLKLKALKHFKPKAFKLKAVEGSPESPAALWKHSVFTMFKDQHCWSFHGFAVHYFWFGAYFKHH